MSTIIWLAPHSVAALGDPNDGGNSGTITFQGGAIRHWSATQSDTNNLYDRYVVPLNTYSWKIDTYTHNINYQSGDNFTNAGGHCRLLGFYPNRWRDSHVGGVVLPSIGLLTL